MKRIICFILAAIMLLSASPVIFAEETDINIFYKDSEIIFEKQTVLKNNIIMCQMEPLFDALGIRYEYNSLTGELLGFFEGENMFSTKIGDSIVTMNRVDVEMEQPFYTLDNTVMVPLDTICYIYNINLDRTDLKNVKIEIIRQVDTYDRRKEIEDCLAEIEKYKNTIISKENLLYFETATREKPETFTEKVVEVEGQEFDKAFDWEVTELTSTYYEAQLASKFWGTSPLEEGDIVVVSLWAKGVYAIIENKTARLGVCAEELSTWQKIVNTNVNLTEDWQKYYFVSTVTKDIENWQLCLRQHFCRQEIQVANIQLDVYRGVPEEFAIPEERVSYEGIEEDALWRKEALKRIEKYRKNNMVINVVDENGNPVENAEVTADMTRHEFLWGANLSHYAIGPENIVTDCGYYFPGFLDEIKDLGINFVVEGNAYKGMYINPKWVQDSYNWCVDNDMETRLHLLFWEMEPTEISFIPEFRSNTWDKDKVSKDEIRKRIETQINKLATFGNTIDAVQIDVVNEVVLRNQNVFMNVGFDETKRMFDLARQMMPDIKLYVTETATGVGDPELDATIPFMAYLKYLREIGCDFDGVGLQGHTGSAQYPQNVYNTIDMAAEYADEVSILEYDMSTDKPASRGPFTRDAIIAAYSHPKCEAFVVWLPMGGGTNDQGIFFDTDGTKRPAYYEWKKMVTEEWMTHEKLKTDNSGNATFRGHRGRYDITVKVGNKNEKITVNLTKDEENNVVTAVVGDEVILSCPNKHIPKEKKYVNWMDYGEMSDVYYPQVNYEHIPETSIEGCYNSTGMELTHLLDEIPTTFWMQGKTDDYVTVELKDAIPLNQLLIDWHDVSNKRYDRKIEVSENGTDWTLISSGVNPSVDETVDMKGYSGKYIKISAAGGKIAINDIQIFAQQKIMQ